MGTWLRRLAILAVLGFPIALLGSRLGFFDFRFGFTIIRYTVMLSALVFVFGLLFMVIQRRSNPASSKAARTAMLLTLLPIFGLGMQMFTARTVPAIHNITTDIADPPQFDAVIALRGDDKNPHTYDADLLGPQQTSAYPNLKTLVVATDKASAHAKSLSIAESLGWEVVAEDLSKGIIEATETTAMWQFKDDIVIRIQEAKGGVEIDLRSVSRVGQSDLGANAKRISKFIQAYQ